MKDDARPNNSSEFDRDREFTVVLEDLHSRFDVFGDGLKALQDKVDLVWETQGKTMERVTMIEITQRKMLTALERHDIRLP